MSDDVKIDADTLSCLPDNSNYCAKGVDWKEVLELRSKGLSQNQIAKICDCSRQNISYLLRQYGKGLERVEIYKKNRADIFAAKQAEILNSITPEKLEKMSPKDAAISAGVLYDKERLERNISTTNITLFSRIIALACDEELDLIDQ